MKSPSDKEPSHAVPERTPAQVHVQAPPEDRQALGPQVRDEGQEEEIVLVHFAEVQQVIALKHIFPEEFWVTVMLFTAIPRAEKRAILSRQELLAEQRIARETLGV